MQISYTACFGSVLAYILLMCVLHCAVNGAPINGHTIDTTSQEIYFDVGEKYTFMCADEIASSSKVTWILATEEIKGYEDYDYEDYGGPFEDKWQIHSVDVNTNEMTLEPLEGAESATTLACKVDGDYSHNIVRIFHLVRAVHKLQSDSVLGRHMSHHAQVCPLYDDKVLRLSCESALRFIKPDLWKWTKGEHSHRSIGHESHLKVTEAGIYNCSYKMHHSSIKNVLSFHVHKATDGERREGSWAFCHYS